MGNLDFEIDIRITRENSKQPTKVLDVVRDFLICVNQNHFINVPKYEFFYGKSPCQLRERLQKWLAKQLTERQSLFFISIVQTADGGTHVSVRIRKGLPDNAGIEPN